MRRWHSSIFFPLLAKRSDFFIYDFSTCLSKIEMRLLEIRWVKSFWPSWRFCIGNRWNISGLRGLNHFFSYQFYSIFIPSNFPIHNLGPMLFKTSSLWSAKNYSVESYPATPIKTPENLYWIETFSTRMKFGKFR